MTTADRKALYARRSSRVWLNFVEISSKNLPETIYLVGNKSAISVGETTYVPCPITLTNPDKGANNLSGSLKISGVTLEYIEMLQELSTDEEITVTTFVAFADNPVAPIDGPNIFKVNEISLTSSTGDIDISMSIESPLDYYVGVKKYNSRLCPAIYV